MYVPYHMHYIILFLIKIDRFNFVIPIVREKYTLLDIVCTFT